MKKSDTKPKAPDSTPEKAKNKTKLSDTKFYKVFKIVRSIFFSVLLVVLVSVMVVTIIARINGNTPTIFGHSIFRVSSGSMEPEYKVGDVLLVKECDAAKLKVGDVITYNGKTSEFAGKIVTHRVVKAPYQKKGETYLVTKGDANVLKDPPIKTSQVIGKVEKKLTILEDLYSFFVTPWGLLTIIALVIIAFFNEIIIFVKAVLGIGYKEEKGESVEEIIERYQKEEHAKEQNKEE